MQIFGSSLDMNMKKFNTEWFDVTSSEMVRFDSEKLGAQATAKGGRPLTQKTSYTSSPTRRSVDTFRLGSLTRAINATHKPIPNAGSENEFDIFGLEFNASPIASEHVSAIFGGRENNSEE